MHSGPGFCIVPHGNFGFGELQACLVGVSCLHRRGETENHAQTLLPILS